MCGVVAHHLGAPFATDSLTPYCCWPRQMRRVRIPFAKVVIAKTKDFASSTKVWVQTGDVVNKVITTGWSWSDVWARLALHMDQNLDFRSVLHRITASV